MFAVGDEFKGNLIAFTTPASSREGELSKRVSKPFRALPSEALVRSAPANSLIPIVQRWQAKARDLDYDRRTTRLIPFEDVRHGTGVYAALQYLEMQADEKWPFEQFRKALEDGAAMDGAKPEARWQVLNACEAASTVLKVSPGFSINLN